MNEAALLKKIEDLERELDAYKNNPAAKFYKALTTAIDGITEKINDKSLKLKDDEFTDAIITLSEKSEKIFKGLKEGLSAFQVQEVEDKAKAKQLGKNQAKAI